MLVQYPWLLLLSYLFIQHIYSTNKAFMYNIGYYYHLKTKTWGISNTILKYIRNLQMRIDAPVNDSTIMCKPYNNKINRKKKQKKENRRFCVPSQLCCSIYLESGTTSFPLFCFLFFGNSAGHLATKHLTSTLSSHAATQSLNIYDTIYKKKKNLSQTEKNPVTFTQFTFI